MPKSLSRSIWEVAGLVILLEILLFTIGYALADFKLTDAGFIAAQEIIFFIIFWVINALITKVKVSLVPTVPWRQIFILALPIYLVWIIGIVALVRGAKNLPLAIAAGIGAGIFEEFFYRGIILGILVKIFQKQSSKTHQIWYPVLITSVLFGLGHMGNVMSQSLPNTLLQVLQAFSLGIIFAAIYLRSGSLFIPMLLHGSWDFSLTAINGGISSTNTVTFMAVVSGIIMDLILFLIGAYFLRSKKLQQIELHNFNK